MQEPRGRGLKQTTAVLADTPPGGIRAVPCARCRTLHTTGPLSILVGPNGAPLVLGPNLYAKCTTAVPAERAPAATTDAVD